MSKETVQPIIPISSLRIGQHIDLAGDSVADAATICEHPEFEFEFEVVEDIIVEESCIVVVFESGFACGFPKDHKFKGDPDQKF